MAELDEVSLRIVTVEPGLAHLKTLDEESLYLTAAATGRPVEGGEVSLCCHPSN